jgi:hypothetical protein
MRTGPDVETTYDPVSRSIEPTRPPLCQCRARVRCMTGAAQRGGDKIFLNFPKCRKIALVWEVNP